MRKAVVRTLQEERVSRVLQQGHAQITSAWELYNGTAVAERKRRAKTKTLQRYKSSMMSAARWLDGKGEIQAEHINLWLNDVELSGATAGYVNTLLRNLRACMRVVAKLERRQDDKPYTRLLQEIEDAIPLEESAPKPRCPPEDFLQRVLPAARNAGEEHFMVILARTAIREGEARGLTNESFDPRPSPHGTLLITRQRNSMKRKNKWPHEVTLDADLAARVRWLMKPTNRLSLASGHGNSKPNQFWFPWSDYAMRKFLAHLRTHLGEDWSLYLPDGCGWHMFRHHAASAKARKTGRTEDVQELLGDRSVVAAQTYMKLLRGVKRGNPIEPIEGFDMSQNGDSRSVVGRPP